MKKLFTLAACLVVALMAGNALATLDWAGNVWPLHNSNHVPTGDISVYAQVYKAGVTDAPGQGADITADLYYASSIDGLYHIVPMTYLGDVGGNDEYTANIPQAALVGSTYLDSYAVFTDETDGEHLQILGDQNGNPPPLRYNVTNVLPNDVTVRFSVCMSGEATTGDVCVIGSAPEIGGWVTGVNLTNVGGDLWEGDVVFAAGGNPTFYYKFRKDGCDVWEGVPDREVILPTDGTSMVVLDVQSWNNLPMGCGLGSNLTEDKVVCIQVCLTDAGTNGGVCVTGNQPEFTNWGTGAPMTLIAPDLYQACFVYPAGTAVPVNLEFKFRKDGCDTWESVGNRIFSVDDSLATETTLTYSWDDGPSACAPVAVEAQSWGTLKGQYR